MEQKQDRTVLPLAEPTYPPDDVSHLEPEEVKYHRMMARQ
jgi:hypothetical protein